MAGTLADLAVALGEFPQTTLGLGLVGDGEAGELDLAPARSGLSGFEARLLLAIECLQSHGAWTRLKACTVDDCRWAFYDTTRNHSRTWCSMDVCGNREKTRRYRARRHRP